MTKEGEVTLPTPPPPPTKPTPPSHDNGPTLPTPPALLPTEPTAPTATTSPTEGTPNPGCGPEDTPEELASYTLPTKEQLDKAFKLNVLDKDGTSRNFGDLCQNGDGGVERNLVIFIRHWFCGVCQTYIKALSASLDPDTLSSLSPPTRLTIIGCGAAALIPQYLETTACRYTLYTDPSASLYKLFGFGRTLEMGPKAPEYIKGYSMFGLSWGGVKQYLKTGWKAKDGGDWKQIGGEFLFVRKGEGWVCVWAHKMRNTRDHAEVGELREVLGMGGEGGAEGEAEKARAKV